MVWIILILELIFLWLTSRQVFQGTYELLVKMGMGRRFSIKILAFIFLPGTIIHELSHMLMAESLRVKTGQFTVWPVEEEGNLKLGSVRVERCDPIRSFFIGIAPLFVGLLVILALVVAVYEALSLNLSIYYLGAIVGIGSYVVFVTANTMFSSRKDIEACLEFLVALVVLGVITYFLWDAHISRIISFLMDEKITQSLSIVVKILAVPLLMNFFIVCIRVLLKR